MRRPPHRHDHRRRSHAARLPGRIVAGSFAVLGLALLALLHSTPGPVALTLLLGFVVVPVVVAFAVVSCATGRAVALLANLIRLWAGHAGLKKLACEARAARATRDIGTREAA